MNERSLVAFFAIPLVWFVAGLVNPGTPPPSKPDIEAASAAGSKVPPPIPDAKAKTTPQKSRRLKTACDVLSDYLALPNKPENAANAPIASFKINENSLAISWQREKGNKDCTIPRNTLPYIVTAFVFVPDPTASSLALETDRSFDAIREALANGGFVPYKSSILPWKSVRSSDSESKKPDPYLDTSEDLDRPGVWLFRHSEIDRSDLRLLFLIGDSPTVGISKPQFQNAVAEFRALTAMIGQEETTLRIVGPVFSGSVDSLAYAVKNICTGDKAKGKDCPIWTITATSGTASVRGIEGRLKKAVGDAAATVTLDQIAQDGALDALLDLLKSTGETAILAESDTVFGLKSAKLGDKNVFPYSHNLMNLRTAYESDKDLMARIFPKSLRPDQLALHFGFTRDPSDALPTYAPENLAVSQQITLRHLASNLHRRHFANLVIVGSDNLDSVFLARFFQEENSNLRIAILDSDALLDREAGSVSLRGVITFSQQPTGSVANPIEFPGGLAFGIYRACRRQLFGLPKDKEEVNRIVSVVGFDGEWPIKVLGPKPAQDGQRAEPPRETSSVWQIDTFKWVPPMFAFVMLLMWLTLAPYGIHRFSRDYIWNPLTIRRVVEEAVVVTAEKVVKDLRREFSHLKTALMRVLLELVPFCRKIATPESQSDLNWDFESEKWRNRWIHICKWTGFMALFVPGLLGFAAIAFPLKTNQYPALVARYFYFGNGVSPLLPLTALLLAIHACAWTRVRSCYLRSYAFCPAPSPLTMASCTKEYDGSEIQYLLKAVRDHAEIFFDRRRIGFLVTAGVVAYIAYDLKVHDVEIELAHKWSWLIWTPLFVATGILIVNAASRFLMLWISLRNLLRRLEFHPLRLGFTSLPDRVSWTSIWSIAGTRPTMVSLQMSSDFLCAIDGLQKPPLTNSALREKIDRFMGTVHEGSFNTDDGAFGTLRQIEQSIKTITQGYITNLSENGSWASQRILGWVQKEEAKSPPVQIQGAVRDLGIDTPPDQFPCSKLAQIDNLKSQFVALQYAAFIRYAFMQLRNLLGFLGTATTLLFIALNVYPFQPMGTLTSFATFLFTISSIVVVTTFYQMDRDPLLSRLSNSTAGKLDSGFRWRLLQFGALPTVTFLATHFPPIGSALVKVVQIIPGLAKL